MASDTPASVEAMSSDDHAPTAPLDEFLAAYEDDDNWWWRIACGHHMNLFEAAIDRIEQLTEENKKLRGRLRSRYCGCAWCCATVPPDQRGDLHKQTCHAP